MYRAGLESMLGFSVHGANLMLAPCVPEHWPKAEVFFKFGASRYEILILNPQGVSRGVVEAELDRVPLPCGTVTVPLIDDGSVHRVRLLLGPSQSTI
jgi:cyclic beta-1,2-glucan synthetase